MSAFLAALLAATESVCVELLDLLGRNDADFVVVAAKSTAAVGDGVNVQFRRLGFA